MSGYELKAPLNYTVFTEGLEVEFSVPTGISLPNGRLEIIYSTGATGENKYVNISKKNLLAALQESPSVADPAFSRRGRGSGVNP